MFLADRIKEWSRVEGTGNIPLDGAAPGFDSFDHFYASGDVLFYAITDNDQYEIGSGVYKQDGSTRVITRNPLRSSNINVGPYNVNGTSSSQTGFFYPLWLTESAAISGVGYSDGPYSGTTRYVFDEFPGVSFYMPDEHQGIAESSAPSGQSYNTKSQPIDFGIGQKEVFVTYPGKSSVYNPFGTPSVNEPRESGVAFWQTSQIINYSEDLTWDNVNGRLGINQPNPEHSLDVGGEPQNSIVRASGFLEGGSGIMFSGGAVTYTGATASGGKQLEPFLRNENHTNGIIALSGLVNQYIGLYGQSAGTVFAGPVENCGSPPCPTGIPTFRTLTNEDLPSPIPVPHITQKTGTFPNTVLQTADNVTIEPSGGVICTYALSEGSGIAVSMPEGGGYAWYKIPATQTF